MKWDSKTTLGREISPIVEMTLGKQSTPVISMEERLRNLFGLLLMHTRDKDLSFRGDDTENQNHTRERTSKIILQLNLFYYF